MTRPAIDIEDLWNKTARRIPGEYGAILPVFGENNTWYFWDETRTNCYGPFDSEEEANQQLMLYCKDL